MQVPRLLGKLKWVGGKGKSMAQSRALVNQVAPSITSDSTSLQPRCNRYGDQFITGGNNKFANYGTAAEGSYFRATTNSWGTGVAVDRTGSTAFNIANANVQIRNMDTNFNGKSIYLDYIKITMIVSSASLGTEIDLGVISMPYDVVNGRIASNGQLTPFNVNTKSPSISFVPSSAGDSYPQSVISVGLGGTTQDGNTSTSGLIRKLSRLNIKKEATAIVTGDVILLQFSSGASSIGPMNGGGPTRLYTHHLGPVVLGPGFKHSFSLCGWLPSGSGGPFKGEVEVGWWER